MSKYWYDAEVQAKNLLLTTSIDELSALIKDEYLRSSKRVLNDLKVAYANIIADGANPLHSHLYQYNRLYEQLAKINARLTAMGEREDKLFTTELTDLYIENYKIVGRSIGAYSGIKREAAEDAIKKIWVDDGLRFSDRIWRNKAALTERLSQTMFDAVNLGKSPDTLTKEIMQDFNVSYNSANRLVRTELAHASVQSTIDKYAEAGIEEYEYVSQPDCCADCMDLDGQIFPIADTEHMPPEHCNCRCSILAVIK